MMGAALVTMADSAKAYLRKRASSLSQSEVALTQGQLQLSRNSRKDFQQEVVVPAADAAFHGDAVLAGMLLQQG